MRREGDSDGESSVSRSDRVRRPQPRTEERADTSDPNQLNADSPVENAMRTERRVRNSTFAADPAGMAQHHPVTDERTIRSIGARRSRCSHGNSDEGVSDNCSRWSDLSEIDETFGYQENHNRGGVKIVMLSAGGRKDGRGCPARCRHPCPIQPNWRMKMTFTVIYDRD